MTPSAVVLLAIVGFLVFWCALSFFIAALGGWLLLGGRYHRTEPYSGPTQSFVSGQMRWLVNYGSCLRVGADPQGLFLAVAFPFRVGHPPLFIPWSDMTVAPSSHFLQPPLTFSFVHCPSARLRLYRGTVELLEQASAGGLRLPES